MFGCDGAPLRERLAVLTTALAHLETFLHRIVPGKISTDRPATMRPKPGVKSFVRKVACALWILPRSLFCRSQGVASTSVNIERLTNRATLVVTRWVAGGKKIYISMTTDEYFIIAKDLLVSCQLVSPSLIWRPEGRPVRRQKFYWKCCSLTQPSYFSVSFQPATWTCTSSVWSTCRACVGRTTRSAGVASSSRSRSAWTGYTSQVGLVLPQTVGFLPTWGCSQMWLWVVDFQTIETNLRNNSLSYPSGVASGSDLCCFQACWWRPLRAFSTKSAIFLFWT